jgi:hypothetical protein
MTTAEEYRYIGDEFLRLAGEAKTEDERKRFFDMALTWTGLMRLTRNLFVSLASTSGPGNRAKCGVDRASVRSPVVVRTAA